MFNNLFFVLYLIILYLLMMPCFSQQTSSGRKLGQDFQSLLEKGKKVFKDQNYAVALQYLKEAEQLQPNNQEVHYYLGYTYERLSAKDGSEMLNTNFRLTIKSSEHFERAIEISPKYQGELLILDPYSKVTGVWGSLAIAYFVRGKVDSAIWAFKEGQLRGGYFPEIMEINENIMASCAKDAILFTNGDNDTYPMWYLQVVENYRTDITVVNLSLLNTPWFIKYTENLKCL
jgi:tetratricopeptide (TPR) repeat protein